LVGFGSSPAGLYFLLKFHIGIKAN
jgi:hypothetical protein